MIINRSMHVPNETFGWVVTQILAAEASRQKSRIEALGAEEKSHV